MAKAKNKVIAGDYEGKAVEGNSMAGVFIQIGVFKTLDLNAKSVDSYEVITDEHRKSAASGVARGIVGGALLGPVGMLAGGISAKSKGIFQVAVQFKDGKRSLIEIDDKVYKALIKSVF